MRATLKLPIFIGFTILVAAGHAQIVPGSSGHGAPSFNCAINDSYQDVDSGLVWLCKTQPNGWVPTPAFQPWGTTAAGIASLLTTSPQTFLGPIAATKMLTVDPWIDPRVATFGASCSNNPAIDDSTAISNALIAAQAAGLEVQISGTCYIQHPIIWPTVGATPDRGFGLRGAATGGSIVAASNFPNTGTASALIYRAYSTNGSGMPVTLRDIKLDANSVASACVTFEAQRQLFVDKVSCFSATGNGGGEMNFGLAAGSSLVGLTARDINIDNYAIIAALGAAARPNYGLYMDRTATDAHVENVVANQNAVAGLYVNSGNNDFVKIHPWGFSALQVPTATWPQYGIYLDIHAFGNTFYGTECDTTQLGCFFASKGFFSAYGTILDCIDGGTGSLCAQYLAVAASGAGHIHFYGGRFQAGSLVASGSPVNWQGSIDPCSDLLTEWPTQQIGCGTASTFSINSILQSPTIFQPTVTGILNETGGSIHVMAAGNTGVINESTDANSFPYFDLKNGTNEWMMQLGSTSGSWQLHDKSTDNLVVQVAEGSPANAILVGTSAVAIGEPLTVAGNATATGALISSGAGTQTMQANSTSASTFPNWLLSNATNGWTGQVNGAGGGFSIKDNSTNNLVFSLSEGAPAGSISVAAGGAVTEALSATATGVTGTLGESDTKVATNAQVAASRASIEIPLPLAQISSLTTVGNNSGLTYTPIQALTVDSIGIVALGTAGSACVTPPVLSVYVAGSVTACSMTVTNGTFSPAPGTCSLAVTANQTIQVKVSTASATCTTSPANATVYLQYH